MKKVTFTKAKKIKKQNRFTKIDRQQGWTLWSLMFVIGVIAFSTYIGFQLIPVYSTNASVKNAMQIAIDDVSPNSATKAAIVRTMRAQLNLDGANDLLDYKKDLVVKRTQREFIVKINYESRVELFYNLSLVASFDNEVKRSL